MKLNLKQISPETPTEAALLYYAEYLERRLHEEKYSMASRLDFLNPTMEIKVDKSTMEHYRVCGVAMSDLDVVDGGFRLTARTSPIEGDGKAFMVTTFVRDPRQMPRSKIANILHEQIKECMYQIRGIFQ